MATPTSRYRFTRNTAAIDEQIDVNWKAIIPRVEKTYGNGLLKALAPEFKVSGSTWARRLAALRARVRDDADVPAGLKRKLVGPEAWLLGALLHEAGAGEHPGTSLLEIAVEALPSAGAALPPKSDVVACTRMVATVLHDFAPTSAAGVRLAKHLRRAGHGHYRDVLLAVIRSDHAHKRKGAWTVLGPSELLAPFRAGRGKDECYAL